MNNKKKGFTLIELIVTIAIISLLGSIGGYFIVNTINNSRDKSNEIAINNIKTSTNTYIKEYSDEIVWSPTTNNEEKTCISTNYLVSKGYLQEDVLKDELPKSIIITRDENLNIISLEEIYEDCNSYSKKVKIPTSKDICNTVTYNGESHNLINTSTIESNYTIKYKDDNFNTNPPVNAGNYKIEANLNEGFIWQDDTTESKEVTCTIKKATPDLIILNSNGQVSTGTSDEELGTITIKVKSLDTDGTISIKNSNKSHVKTSIENKNITKGEEKEIKINILATRDTATYITITLTPENTSNYKTNSIEYTIGKVTNKEIAIPTCNTLTYNGDEQTLIEKNEGYTLLDNKATNYGIHTVTAILNYGYTWEDNSLENKELKCEIKRPTPTVTYTNATCYPSTKTVTYEDKYGDLCNPSKTGYTFDGWYTNTNYTTKITSESTVTNFNNHNIYAKWTPITYTIKYDCNGGTGSTASSSHTYGISSKLTTNNCSKTNHTFQGWATSSSGNVTYSDNQTVTNLTTNEGTVTLYAKYQSITITVTFNSNYTGGGTKTQTFTYGVANQKFSQTFSRTGYVLLGWSSSSTATTPTYTVSNGVADSWIKSKSPNTTLYAVWVRQATNTKTNGMWNIYSSPGYTLKNNNTAIYDYNWCRTYTSGTTEHDTAQKNYHIGTSQRNATVYVNVPIVSKVIDNTTQYGTCDKKFYKIYIKDYNQSDIRWFKNMTTITDRLTINGSTYYGVWISANCTNPECPPNDSLNFG